MNLVFVRSKERKDLNTQVPNARQTTPAMKERDSLPWLKFPVWNGRERDHIRRVRCHVPRGLPVLLYVHKDHHVGGWLVKTIRQLRRQLR